MFFVHSYNFELRKNLTGKNLNISPYITERSEGISGYTDKEGLKTAFELIYGYFTEPRIDQDIFFLINHQQLYDIINSLNLLPDF
jgi:hypothetical protein